MAADHPWTAPGCSIVTAYAESARGPGWDNTPIWVVWREAGGRLHHDCLQPVEQTDEMRVLYEVSAAAHAAMLAAVSRG